MKFARKTLRKSEEDLSSSVDSVSHDYEFFGSACSDSDGEIGERRSRLHYNTPQMSASNGSSRNSLRTHAAMEHTPLLGTADQFPRRPYIVSNNNNNIGPTDHKSEAILDFYKRNQPQDKPDKKHQSSLVTIFSVWNTMLGSSLLAMAWGVGRAGLPAALLLTAFMGALCLYTAHLLLRVRNMHGGVKCEVPALCRILLGRWAELVAHGFSLMVLLGANIVYWILVANFLYYTVNYVMDINSNNTMEYNSTVICPNNNINNSGLLIPTQSEDTNSVHSQYWGLHTTVPIYAAFLLFPLLNFKSPSFFTKFNSLGTLSVVYLLIFVSVKGWSWGVHPALSGAFGSIRGASDAAVLSGMLALSFYIHNIIITIMSHNAQQENNGRDLTIAFILVTITYALVGAVFYICFPLAKSCIEDNILNNFEMHDVMTAVARALLLFQVITIYPLVAFMLRTEAILLLPLEEGLKKNRCTIVGINIIIVTICILFACFCPSIGTIIRYTGAISGLVHVFALPSLLQLKSLKLRNKLTLWKALFYSLIMLFGSVNFLMQFFITT